MSPCSYYDIDEILAEEELIPVTSNFDFAYLAHLDPEYTHASHHVIGKKGVKNYLAEGTRFKMPLWSIQIWAEKSFITLRIPKHYGKRIRERLDADPVSVDLRKRNERYYRSGMAIIRLIHNCPQDNNNNNPTKLVQESTLLKKTLLESYTGTRLRRIFDWTLSSIEDDVSHYTKRLSQMELALFQRGAQASHAYSLWKSYGTRRIHVSETALRTSALDYHGVGVGSSVTPPVSEEKMKRMRGSVGQNATKVSPEVGEDSHLSMQRAKKRLRGF